MSLYKDILVIPRVRYINLCIFFTTIYIKFLLILGGAPLEHPVSLLSYVGKCALSIVSFSSFFLTELELELSISRFF
jgi:hypothetical protein